MLTKNRRRPVLLLLFLVLLGIARTTITLDRPAMAGIRGVDVVSLLGAGFCFGVAFGMGAMLYFPRNASNQ